MGLDYSKGCVNFRDVGEFINLLAGAKLIPENRLYRGGKLDSVEQAAQIGNPGTIINLRRGTDRKFFNADYYQISASNNLEKYDTSNKEVKHWLNEVLRVFEKEELRYPVLIHCTSGKDRTGVVMAAILTVLGVPGQLIIAEYLLSDGEVKEEWIQKSLDGMSDTNLYFNKIDLNKVRFNILHRP
jgi:protein-tyrosine phosphatase